MKDSSNSTKDNNIFDSVAPCWDSRYKLISLGEIMDALRAENLVKVGNWLAVMGIPALIGRLNPRRPETEIEEDTREIDSLEAETRADYVRYLTELKEYLPKLGLNVTLPKVDRLLQKIQEQQADDHDVSHSARLIGETLADELGTKLFLQVLPDNAPYYIEPFKSWGIVAEKFPSALVDIEEAGKCFALERYTASVFHLMRVAELGLSSMARRVGLENPRSGWEEAIKYIEGQLNKNYNEMSGMFKGDVEFLSGIAAHMRTVNLAWRRRVAHIERNYNREEAKGIYDATASLMLHIAQKLSEAEG